MRVVRSVYAAAACVIPTSLLLAALTTCPPFLVVILLDVKLCNVWVLSCQHQLQILALGGVDRSAEEDAARSSGWQMSSFT